MEFIVNPDPAHPPTIGQRIDSQLALDEQTFEALDAQHRQLAARVDGMAATVAMLEALIIGPAAERNQ
jgi:hypothetical protein